MGVALAAFSLAAVLIVLLPGPDTLVVLRELMRDGRRRAAQTVAGVLCGLAVWVGAAAFGLSALLRASHTGFIVLKIAGGAYLIWLGVQSLRLRRLAERPQRRLLGRGFIAGLATDLLNPKVGVFYVSFLPQFVPAQVPAAPFIFLLAAIHGLLGAAWFAALIAGTAPLKRWLQRSVVVRWLDRATGAVFLGFGARLALERR